MNLKISTGAGSIKQPKSDYETATKPPIQPSALSTTSLSTSTYESSTTPLVDLSGSGKK